ncbi:MAG TPA: type II secretion system F family protein [Bryobacteraceae bacterium]|jgi:tight adherence protein C
MGLTIFAFAAIFLLVGSAGLLLFYRAEMMQRLSAVLSPRSQEEKRLSRLSVDHAGMSLKAVVQPFEKVLPKSPKEVSVVQKRLIRAGYREDAYVKIFYGAKVLVPVLLCGIAAVTGASRYGSFFVYVMALALGYLAPDFWLGKRITRRQMNIRTGLPEFLDLLVVCIEAGLSLDQALARSVDELRASQPEISDELGLVLLEQRAGRPRLDAWKNLAERVDIDIIRTLVAALVQADQFGTSVAKSLRVFSETLRVQRRQRVEELAAKTSVKLVFPLVLFIFPSIFVVVLGPTIIVMLEQFKSLLK